MNEIVSVIMMKSKKLETIKKGTKKSFSLQSPKVGLQGLRVPAAMRSSPRDPMIVSAYLQIDPDEIIHQDLLCEPAGIQTPTHQCTSMHQISSKTKFLPPNPAKHF